MFKATSWKRFTVGLSLATAVGIAGCAQDGSIPEQTIETTEQAITDVAHSTVERQSIGNCWLYAQASWVESMALSATPDDELDASQSYWTYWHWFDQVTGFFPPEEISTGGFQFTANQIVRDRGLMVEGDFVPEDTAGEMSLRQDDALDRINEALENGEFEGADGKKAREIFDEAVSRPCARAPVSTAPISSTRLTSR
jgi:hypothetical protein